MLNLKREIRADCKGRELPNEEQMKDPDVDGYKYPDILMIGNIFHRDMKTKTTTIIYLKHLKHLLKSKLDVRDLVNDINIWTFFVSSTVPLF